MAKGKKKPASKPSQGKKVEPIVKDEAVKVKKISPKEEVVKKVKEEAPKKEKKVSKHSFPGKDKCLHTNTKRTIDRRLRVMHVCTECGTIVRFGGR